MKNAIIVHGRPGREEYYSDKFPSSSNFCWIPWLQKQLIIHDIKADTPEMPFAFDPNYELWKKEFERFDITPETILVGHSAGCNFLLRWLSEHADTRVESVILVAPSIDPLKKRGTEFYNFEIDQSLSTRIQRFFLVASDHDSDGVNETVNILRKKFPEISFKEFPGYGHFILKDMGTEKFPELVDIIFDKRD